MKTLQIFKVKSFCQKVHWTQGEFTDICAKISPGAPFQSNYRSFEKSVHILKTRRLRTC